MEKDEIEAEVKPSEIEDVVLPADITEPAPVVSEPLVQVCPHDNTDNCPSVEYQCGDTPFDACDPCDMVGDICPTCAVTAFDPETMGVGDLFGTMQQSVVIIWRYHLKTNKHHNHVILKEFYDAAVDIIDNIIEHWQGTFSIVNDYVNRIDDTNKEEVAYLRELKAFVNEGKLIISQDATEIHSDIDDLLGLIDSTIYKLTAFNESNNHFVKFFDEYCYEDLRK